MLPQPNFRQGLTVLNRAGHGLAHQRNEACAVTQIGDAGDLSRFVNVGHFASYCRCVNSERRSNDKKKGQNNAKNGNPNLAWAFYEAAHFGIQFLPSAKRFYEKKAAQRNPILAMKALSNKVARACYYVMRDRVPFDPARLFG